MSAIVLLALMGVIASVPSAAYIPVEKAGDDTRDNWQRTMSAVRLQPYAMQQIRRCIVGLCLVHPYKNERY